MILLRQRLARQTGARANALPQEVSLRRRESDATLAVAYSPRGGHDLIGLGRRTTLRLMRRLSAGDSLVFGEPRRSNPAPAMRE